MQKVLIANRGEIACRIIRTCRRLNLSTVAVYSEADAQALHVEMADEGQLIGPGPARESYLLPDRILEAARVHGADAIHPGYGFLSENPGFARRVEEAGLIWIGPRPDTIEAMGDKERAREIAQSAGVPVLPGSPRFAAGELRGLSEAAERIGFPLLVKAAAGGGGIGMRRVDAPEPLIETAQATQSMAAKSFGDGTIYLERFIPRARHVEAQVFGFGGGDAVHLFERDCSLQRRFQKIIEESPAPGLPASVREEMASAATLLCKEQRYSGAGTIEFIVDAETFEFFFLEMNTRIQVEHPVTEMITGLDLVELQLELARERLAPFTQSTIHQSGHGIECRLYAEDPSKNFMPSPGRLSTFRLPETARGVRIDTGFREGDTISFFYDPMIAKIICHGQTRRDAIGAMMETLDAISIEGLRSNLKFLKNTMRHPAFLEGEVFTGFVDRYKPELIAA